MIEDHCSRKALRQRRGTQRHQAVVVTEVPSPAPGDQSAEEVVSPPLHQEKASPNLASKCVGAPESNAETDFLGHSLKRRDGHPEVV